MKADLPNLRVSPLMKIDGGVSQNDFVNQFIANMTGREIIRHPHPDQMTALGAAFLAGLGAGANHLHVRPLHIMVDSTLSLRQAFGSRRRS
jgi:glycerol kinase